MAHKSGKDGLRSVYLGNCSFIGTDVHEINFSDVTWRSKRGAFFTRKLIYDEISETKDRNRNYRVIEETYRQLKKNYEARGSYGEAGDFHYGEMEMQRLALKGIFRYISLNSFYKLLSGYGEKQWLAVLWIFFFTGLFAASYLMCGIKTEEVIIDYKWAFNWPLFTKSFWYNISDVLLHTFEVATFARRPVFTAASKWTSFIEIFQRIITPILVTLLILAIKRRFKR